ncbi:ABC transporter ATP-binding protein [Pseudochryseolinea flava]|uniref:ABC transporter ATP-binding protein n=1 Tax=Pseudochryseolinea flava TaxID=2059302 RepID=A0A364Y9M4_9BACT|nr:ABC transporter transmembrane domain-containing protein [Pseudochryseolinea flava]RAW03069.1 ABC transporter ATP-binding protein [Pseudochryseolinea flava]
MAKRSGKEPLREEEKRKLTKDNLRKLAVIFRFMAPYRWIFALGLLALFLSSSTLLIFPRLAGELVDVANGKSNYFTSITQLGLALLLVLVVQGIFSFVRVYTFAIVTEKGLATLRKTLFSKLVWLPLTFYDQRRTGELMSRISSDVTVLNDLFSITLAEFFRQIVMLIGGSVIIAVLSPKLTVFMLLIFPIIVVLGIVFGKFIRKTSSKSQDKLASANVIVEESLQSVTAVKSFTNEQFEIGRYVKMLDEAVKVSISSARYRAIFISFLITIVMGGIVAIACYGASLVQSGDLKSGQLFSFVLYTAIIGISVAGLGDIFGQIQKSIGASERVLDILDENDEQSSLQHIPLEGKITFNNVSFIYPTRQDHPVLKELNFSISPGEKIALVGPSGSGKSTITNLLMRFYPVQQGQILVDNIAIQEYNLSGYRQNIGIVPQEVLLFGGSIAENIAYGKPDASIEQIREAARKANALEFIESFPDKFETLVGERGVKLSGGQRQRVAIARAILKDPAILILDEATSSLDAQSEVLVQQALEKLMEGRTTIIIAHRLSTIKKVDRIFVIKEGRLAETGSHAELTQVEGGIYSNLLKLQLQ